MNDLEKYLPTTMVFKNGFGEKCDRLILRTKFVTILQKSSHSSHKRQYIQTCYQEINQHLPKNYEQNSSLFHNDVNKCVCQKHLPMLKTQNEI